MEYLGEPLRWVPDVVKRLPLAIDGPTNIVGEQVMMSVHGSRKIGIANVLLKKGIHRASQTPMYTVMDFTVDTCDGRVWRLPAGYEVRLDILLDRLAKEQQAQRNATSKKMSAQIQ